MSARPPILVITGYGLNCEDESSHAWRLAGADPQQVHLSDLLERPQRLHEFAGLMFIGGFSYGDHIGSGQVFALRVRHRLVDHLQRFIEEEKLILGICNGFQIMVKLGLLPGLDGEYFTQRLALIQNDCGAFQNYWVHLRFEQRSPCVFTRGLDAMTLPVRHGEGKLFTTDQELLATVEEAGCVACRYVVPGTGAVATRHPENPNGSLNGMAGLCDPTGRVYGMMPHPEAYLFAENHPDWIEQAAKGSLPESGLGVQIFRNAVDYLAG